MGASHKCPACGIDVPDERFELLGVLTCVKCTPQGERPLGVVEYAEKAGGVLIIAKNREEFEYLRKPANQRR